MLTGNLYRQKTGWFNWLLASLFLWLSACVDEVYLPIRQTASRLVVDGYITDEAPPYPIKLTLSGAYSSGGVFPEDLVINGAIATISDDRGQTVRLEQDPLQPSYYWARDPAFRGQINRSYTLRVVLPDGTTYVSAPELLKPVAPIEQVYAKYIRQATVTKQPDYYQVMIDTKDPATPEDYYRWSAYGYVWRWTGTDPLHSSCNTCSCLVPYYGPLTNVLSDALVNGNRIGGRTVFNSPVYAIGKQYVEVRQYSISRAAYQYWKLFDEQRTRTGSLFDPQPASIEGNVYQKADTTVRALGFFGASAVSTQRLVIRADTINYNQFLNRYKDTFIPPGECQNNFPSAQFGLAPAGW